MSDLSEAFKIPAHSSNSGFALNPYKPGVAKCMNVVCFSLTSGAISRAQQSINLGSAGSDSCLGTR
jgi:hypothetical protein